MNLESNSKEGKSAHDIWAFVTWRS